MTRWGPPSARAQATFPGFVYQNTDGHITFDAQLSSVRRESRGDTTYGAAEEIIGVENPWRAGVDDEQCCPDRARIEK